MHSSIIVFDLRNTQLLIEENILKFRLHSLHIPKDFDRNVY
jgi:hypothetical protein